MGQHNYDWDDEGATATLPAPPSPTPPPRQSGERRRGGSGRAVVLAALVAALVSASVAVPVTLALREGAVSTGGEEPAVDRVPDAGAVPAVLSVAEVAETVLPSVARVDVQTAAGPGSGSAVAYREDGYLLTNAHVVSGAERVSVTLPEGSTLPAVVVGGDPVTDIAVLQLDVDEVPGGRLPTVTFADELPQIGEIAIAVGSPFGLDTSVTSGIVSGLGRSVPGTALRDLIQTDAPINPGNSGGPLVNDRAEVIGINTAILPASPTARGNIGIGFATPSPTASAIADQLIDTGSIQHAHLGVHGQNLDPGVAELYGLPVSQGAVVVEVVPGSPADEAGLQQGDIVIAVDEDPVDSMAALAGDIRRRSPGDEVTLTLVRGGQELELQVRLATGEEPGS